MSDNMNGHSAAHKGQPSGNKKESSGLQDAFAGTNPETEERLTNEYMKDGDEGGQPAENVHLLHHNRNPNKGDTMKDPRK